MLNEPALFYIVLLLLYTHTYTHTTDLNSHETTKEGLSFTTIQGQIHRRFGRVTLINFML